MSPATWRGLLLAAALLLPSPALADAADLPALRRRADAVDVLTAVAHLRATFPAVGVARVRVWPLGAAPPEGSFAVEPAVPLPLEAVEEEGEEAEIRAGGLTLRVNRRTLAFALLDAGGAPVAEAPEPADLRPGGGGRIAFALAPGEEAYGLGDKVRGLSRRGRAFDLWNYDAFGWRSDTDPLYKSIPFLLLLRDGRARGVFVDAAARSHVDVGAARADRLGWEVERGALDLYLLAGPGPAAVVEAYTGLTGRPPLPPRWALGYHQSRYSYRSEAEVRALVARFRKERFPLDAVWLDIDFQEHRAPFRVDRRRFPRFEKLVADLLAAGVRTVVVTDPHLWARKGKEPFASGLAGDHLILDPAAWPDGGGPPPPGAPPLVAEAWPGPSAFPELTLARTRAWFGSLYRPYVKAGVAGFWDDMNEPALFNVLKSMPPQVRHRLEGGGSADHVAVHNAYGLLQARATQEGVRALRPGVRPFVLTRAAYAGSQRWAATWTGDNRSDREGLALTVPTLLNLGVSGFALAGADVGGFEGCPDAALLTDWTALGALQPFFRNHSNQGTCRREPWVHGPAELARRRAAVERRYRLLPFLYTLFEEASRTGLPVMRPLWLEHPDDAAVLREERAFLLGRDLLVAPRLSEGHGPYPVVLPAGGWWDADTGERLEGGQVDARPPPGEGLKLYVRAGAIVPEGPAVRAAEAPRGVLALQVWPGPDCRGALYLDAGEGDAHLAGELRRIRLACQEGPDGITVTAASEGGFPTWWSAVELAVHGAPGAPSEATEAGGAALQTRHDPARRIATVLLPGGAADFAVTLRW